VGLERGPLSLVSTIEEVLGRNISDFGLENREYGRGDPLREQRDTLYQLKLALTSPTGCGRSVGIVSLRTKATEFVCLCGSTCHDMYTFLPDTNILKHITYLYPVVVFTHTPTFHCLCDHTHNCLSGRQVFLLILLLVTPSRKISIKKKATQHATKICSIYFNITHKPKE
jgi:hypothetical protein